MERSLDPFWQPVTSTRFERVGQGILGVLFTAAFAGVLWTGAVAAEWLWLFPVAVLGTIVAPYAVRTSGTAYLAVVLGFVFIASFEKGIQVSEVAYTAVFLLYLALWFVRRWTTGERLIWSSADAGVAVFVGWSLLSAIWAPFVSSQPAALATEASLVALLLFYFPTRDIVVRHRHGASLVMTAIAGLGLYAAVRNLLNYRRIILEAVFDWQTNIGRITTNEMLLVAGALVLMAMAVSMVSPWRRTASAGALVLVIGALIITQSRAFWIDFLLGATAMLLALQGQPRRRLLGLSVLGAGLLVAVGLLLFPSAITGIANGLLARFETIGSAVSSDISLRSRFYESAAVFESIRRNPLLGYGLAARFSFYDIILDVTVTRSFVHNGYVGLLFKGGLIGFGAMMMAWGGMLVLAYRSWRMHRRGQLASASIVALAGLVALFPSSSTSIHFYVGDTILTMALLGGLASGLYRRGHGTVGAVGMTPAPEARRAGPRPGSADPLGRDEHAA